MTQPGEQADPAAQEIPRDEARSIVDELEAKLDEQYPDRSATARRVPQSQDVAPEELATDTTGREPPD